MMIDKDEEIARLEQQNDLLRDSVLRYVAALEAIDRLLERRMVTEARAVACCGIDRRFNGQHDGDGGALGRLVKDRYEPYDHPGQPDYIVIEPRHHVKKETV